MFVVKRDPVSGGDMTVGILHKIIIRMAIIASLALYALGSDAVADCDWTTTIECYTGENVHGATIENMSPPFDISFPSYKYIYLLPAWWCNPNGRTSPLPDECFHPPVCYTFLVTRTWQPDAKGCCNSPDKCCGKETSCVDDTLQTCTTSEGCPGTQTCNNCKWSICEKKDPCCPTCSGDNCGGK